MLDIPSLSAVVAAVGVIVGVVFAILQLRDLVKTRQTDLVIRLYSTTASNEWLEAWEKLRNRETTDYNEYEKEYGLIEYFKVGGLFEQVGALLHRKLLDTSLVYDVYGTFVRVAWEKIRPLAEGRRKQSNRPDVFENFEYLYNEMQKREQRPQQTQQ